MLPRRFKISSRLRIEHIFKKGLRFRAGIFQFRYLPNRLRCFRFALITSKKTGSNAVERNRARRKIYEAIRKNFSPNLQSCAKTCYDTLVVCPPEAASKKFLDINLQIAEGIKKLTKTS